MKLKSLTIYNVKHFRKRGFNVKIRATTLSLLALFILIFAHKLYAYTVTIRHDGDSRFEMIGGMFDSSGVVNCAPVYRGGIELPSGSWMSMENNIELWVERFVSPGNITSVIHARGWTSGAYNFVKPGYGFMSAWGSVSGHITVVPEFNGIPSPIMKGTSPDLLHNGFIYSPEQGFYYNYFEIPQSGHITGGILSNSSDEWSWSWECTMTLTETAPEPVPEPSTMLLLASGLVGLAGLMKRLRRH